MDFNGNGRIDGFDITILSMLEEDERRGRGGGAGCCSGCIAAMAALALLAFHLSKKAAGKGGKH